jgi:hypothetical protein
VSYFRGANEMINTLKEIAKKFPDRVASAIYQEAQIEMTESKRRVPVDTGVLRASGFVAPPERNGNHISVTLSYGGAADNYAVIQHENLEFHHKHGQAKYLESVLNESRQYMAARIARRVDLNQKA